MGNIFCRKRGLFKRRLKFEYETEDEDNVTEGHTQENETDDDEDQLNTQALTYPPPPTAPPLMEEQQHRRRTRWGSSSAAPTATAASSSTDSSVQTLVTLPPANPHGPALGPAAATTTTTEPPTPTTGLPHTGGFTAQSLRARKNWRRVIRQVNRIRFLRRLWANLGYFLRTLTGLKLPVSQSSGN
jgi:hypothetical protein